MKAFFRHTLTGLFFAITACGSAEEHTTETLEDSIRASGKWTYVETLSIQKDPGTISEAYVDETPGQADTPVSNSKLERDYRLNLITANGHRYKRNGPTRAPRQFAETASFFSDQSAEIAPDEVSDEIDKAIWGSDTRSLWSHTTSHPARTHVALRGAGSSTAYCSGVFIGPRHILTAGHCIYDDGELKRDVSDIRVVAGQDGSGFLSANRPYGSRRVAHVVTPTGWIEDENYDYDYAIIVLRNTSFSTGWLGMAVYSWSSLSRASVNINGYSSHYNSCSASPLSSGDCGGYLYHGYGSVMSVSSRRFYYKIDTQTGQSGSPVYRLTGGDRYVVGVHSGFSSSSNRATRMVSRMFNTICDVIEDYPSAFYYHECE